MCAPCRTRTRENARRRRHKKKLGGVDPGEAERSRDGEGSLSPESEDEHGTPVSFRVVRYLMLLLS